ncbi:MAG TPA: TonB-dependent receptor [Gemmatimonadaceae bacterium]|nr:TonB-dependent receptor [Gemmatimonadaceae bacterium]
MRFASSARSKPSPRPALVVGDRSARAGPGTRRSGLARQAAVAALALLAALGIPLVSQRAIAQDSTSAPSLLVIVTDEMTQEPVVGAQVGLKKSRMGALTDSLGIVRLSGLPVGRDTLVVRFLGYAPLSTVIDLQPDVVTEAQFAMRKEVAELPTVTVRGKNRPSPGPGFENRQRMGFGHFVTREDIERYSPSTSSDILRQVPGVHLIPIRGGGYQVRFTRSTSRCRVQYYIDNLPVSTEELIDAAIDRRNLIDASGGSANAQARSRARKLNRDIPSFHIDQLNPEDIEAIEVYRGAAEIPVEYNRSGSLCGVILIWMRKSK